MIERLGLDESSHVVEIASNDGYLLQFFHERQIPVLGIEPAANVAEVALAEGHSHAGRVLRARDGALAGGRVGRRSAARQQRARARPRPQRLRRRHEDPAQARRRDHDGVPAPDAPDRGQPVGHDLPRALLLLLVPHRQPRVRGPRAAAVRRRGAAHARRLAARLRRATPRTPTSPRARRPASCASASATPATSGSRPTSATAGGSRQDKRQILRFLIDLKEQGLRIVGYGAPAKGNTLLNYCGVRRDFIDYTCDLNPHKQGHFLPGSHIPIRSPERSARTGPTSC